MKTAPEIYRVEAVPVGQLFIMPCPRVGNIREDITYYQSLGIDSILSLLEVEEADDMGLGSEALECEAAGLEFLSFPITDFSVPERAAFMSLIHDVAARLRNGRSIAVHCRAGIGRSGMVVCSVLGALGVSEAIAKVRHARGADVPDTAAQRAFIEGILAEFS